MWREEEKKTNRHQHHAEIYRATPFVKERESKHDSSSYVEWICRKDLDEKRAIR